MNLIINYFFKIKLSISTCFAFRSLWGELGHGNVSARHWSSSALSGAYEMEEMLIEPRALSIAHCSA